MSRHENTEHTSLENMLNFLFITIIKPIVIKNMPCHAHVHAHVKKAWCHKKAVRCRRNDRRFAAGMACLCYGIPQHLHQMAASPFHSQFGGDSPPPNGDALNAFYRNGGCLWLFLHWRMIQDLSQGAVHFLF